MRQPEKFHQVVDDMLTLVPSSCRRLAAKLDLDKITIWRWRKRIIDTLTGIGGTGFGYERLKLPSPARKFQIPVLTITDRSGARRADMLPNRRAGSLIALLARHVGPDAVLCSDGDPAYRVFAQSQAIPHYQLNAKTGPRVIQKAFHIQTINNLHSRFETL